MNRKSSKLQIPNNISTAVEELRSNMQDEEDASNYVTYSELSRFFHLPFHMAYVNIEFFWPEKMHRVEDGNVRITKSL